MTRSEKIAAIRNSIENRQGTMKQFADRCEVSVSTLYRFSSDSSAISDSTLDDLLEKLGALPPPILSADDEAKYSEFIRRLVKKYGSNQTAAKLGVTQGTMYGYKKLAHRLTHALPKMLAELRHDPEAYAIAEEIYFKPPAPAPEPVTETLPPPVYMITTPPGRVGITGLEYGMLPAEEQLPPPPPFIGYSAPVPEVKFTQSEWFVVSKDELASKLVYGKRFLLKALDDKNVLMQVEA